MAKGLDPAEHSIEGLGDTDIHVSSLDLESSISRWYHLETTPSLRSRNDSITSPE